MLDDKMLANSTKNQQTMLTALAKLEDHHHGPSCVRCPMLKEAAEISLKNAGWKLLFVAPKKSANRIM